MALVLGGNVNGYNIVRELHDSGVSDIRLIDYQRSIASYSNRLKQSYVIEQSSQALKDLIHSIKEDGYFIIYPTSDLHIEHLHEIYAEINDFCFVPFNQKNILSSLDKMYQYETCEKFGIPYPKTYSLDSDAGINELNGLKFPLLLKPNKREDLTQDIFRSLYLEDIGELGSNVDKIKSYLQQGFTFVVSEYIPGDDTNIYAYTGYRSQQGKILNGWVGKKLNQFPNLFGVFSSAKSIEQNVVKKQGEALLHALDVHGIAEPEFKYDMRDGKYKLMEVNLRSMMWHRVGNMSGVKLQYTQWLDAQNMNIPVYEQETNYSGHFIYFTHEICNLIARSGYRKFFKENLFGSHRDWAIYDSKDIKPFIFGLTILMKRMVGACLRRLKLK